MALQPGTRLGNYEVLSELGAGGMGEVYKARDLKLGREVAIKVLPKDMASDSQRLRRFEQEARAASALNHPNIVTIYEIGEHEGTPYIAMEYVDGVTLRELLAGGAVPHDKLIRYTQQMAEGLAKAHQVGIVHRDLKPENIIVSEDGYIKILDFGLAKLLPEGVVGAEVATLTRETALGVILGTIGYMSPEQAKGVSADFRSDQFSFGTIVYELATGKRAFQRDSAAQTLTAIIEDEPELVTVVNPNVAATIARMIDRCLSKDPAKRYDSTWEIAKDAHGDELATPVQPSLRHPLATLGIAGVVATALVMVLVLFAPDIRRWVDGAADAPRIEAIAVLPLENLSGDPEQEYFADGMTEALITDLAKIGTFRVISRTSAYQYKGTDKTLPEIAKELNVDAIVEGSAFRVGDNVRITAQLIHAETDEHLWAERYDRDLRDVFALQSELAAEIAREVQLTLTPAEQARPQPPAPPARAGPDPEVYADYLKGRYYWNQRTGESMRIALEHFENAIAGDPSYARAYAGLADTYAAIGHYTTMPLRESLSRAKAAALQALAIDDTLSEPLATLAQTRHFLDWDLVEAENAYRRALELNPGYASAHEWYAECLLDMGRFDDALAEARRAQELDPLSPIMGTVVGNIFFFSRQYDNALEQYQRILEFDPNFGMTHFWLGRTYVQQSNFSQALSEFRAALSILGDDPKVVSYIAYADALSGNTTEARTRLVQLDEQARQGNFPAFGLATIHIGLGDTEAAFAWLDKAIEERNLGFYLPRNDPLYDPLRDDPRFRDLLRRINFSD